MGGTFRFDVDGVALGRDDQRNDQRFTGEMNWKQPTILGDGQIWTFVLDARGDAYHFDVPQNGPPGTSDDTLERGTAYAGLDWRWPFHRFGAAPDHSYVLELLAQFIAQPYGGNPVGLRDEDSTDFEFDENDVFSVQPGARL